MSEDHRDWKIEVLSRPPLRVDGDTAPESLQAELTERLEALLASYNGLEPTAEGWRALALALALKHEPAFRIKTPVDRASRNGRLVARVGFETFRLRSKMKALMGKYRAQRYDEGKIRWLAAGALSRQEKGMTRKKAYDLVAPERPRGGSPRYQNADFIRRMEFEKIAEKSMALAASVLSQNFAPPTANETDA